MLTRCFLGLCILLCSLVAANAQSPRPPRDTVAQKVASEALATADIAKEALRATVVVYTYRSGNPVGLGSGFVASKDGKIVTNHHVIAGCDSAMVKFQDGAFYSVEGVLGFDENADLAVLKLKTSGRDFTPLLFGDATQSSVGDSVIAVGNPMGLEGTVSTGIISAKRSLNDLGVQKSANIGVLQITAPLSSGSSGGALLDSKGGVIGVPFVQMVAGQNLNFAIPINYVFPLLADAQVKPLAGVSNTVAVPAPSAAQTEEDIHDIEGTYTGVWQSGSVAGSGATTMRISVRGVWVTADVFLTGSELTTVTLTGTASSAGRGVWTVTLSADNLKKRQLSVRGIFRNDAFVGDYNYRRGWTRDSGQWLVKKN